MATTFTVTTLIDENDFGATVGVPGGTGLSLREAIALANATAGDDTIVFDATLAGGTLRLTHADGTLQVTEALTIDGDTNDNGTPNITISGDVIGDDTTIAGTGITSLVGTGATELDDNVQILSSLADIALDGLVLTGGVSDGSGGAASSTDAITLTNSTVSGNHAAASGGGINADTVNINNSIVSDNVPRPRAAASPPLSPLSSTRRSVVTARLVPAGILYFAP